MFIGKRTFHMARMRPDRGDNAEIVVSTAKEGLFKGLSTWIRNTVPFDAMTAKIFYMPAMNRKAIHQAHDALIELIENNLKIMCPLEIAIIDGLGWIKSTGCTHQIVVADWFTRAITENLASYSGRTVTQINMGNTQDIETLLKKWLSENTGSPWP
jgi:hypothetical protein